jgi:hypothetical protein
VGFGDLPWIVRIVLGLAAFNLWVGFEEFVIDKETKCDSTNSCVVMRRYWVAKMTGMGEMTGVTAMVRTSAFLALPTYLIPRTAQGHVRQYPVPCDLSSPNCASASPEPGGLRDVSSRI